MAKKIKMKMNIKPASAVLAVLALIIVLGINSLAYFNVVNLASQTLGILTIIGALFVLIEVSVVKMLKNIRKTDAVSIIGMLVAVFTLIGGVIAMFGSIPAVIGPALGMTNALLVIFIIIEAFRK